MAPNAMAASTRLAMPATRSSLVLMIKPRLGRNLFPFELSECCSSVARIILIEQGPAILFRLSRLRCRCGEGRSSCDQLSDIRGQPLQVMPLGLQRGGPLIDHISVTGNDAAGGDAREIIHRGEPAQDGA